MIYSIIIPVYNSEETLEKLITEISKNIRLFSQSYEIILVDDCSIDGSYEKLKNLKKKDKRIKLYRNRLNIGQHKSIQLGLIRAKGKKMFVMDCDLQDDPKYFSKFINKYNKNKNTVVGLANKKSYNKGFSSYIFWSLLNFISKKKFYLNITTFALIPLIDVKKIIKSKNFILLYGELVINNINIDFINIVKKERKNGTSAYNFIKCLLMGFNIFRRYL